MPPAWRLARTALWGRPGRTALLLFATTLAAALVAAVACSIASARDSVAAGFGRFIGNADARIIHPAGGRFDESLLELVRAWPEVAAATGRLGGSLTLVPADGPPRRPDGTARRTTPQVVGVEFDLLPRFRRIELDAGRLPESAAEILIDPRTAGELDLDVGGSVMVQRFGPPIRLTVVGIEKRPDLGALQRPRIHADRRMLAEATGRPGALTGIRIDLAEGVDVAAFCDARGGELPAEVLLEPAELVRTGFDRRSRYGDIALRVLTTMAFISCGFIVVIGLTSGVHESQRELAMLRAVGASRAQLFGGQMLSGLLLGAGGAAAGAPVGIALAWVLVRIWRSFIPEGLSLHGPGLLAAAAGSVLAGGVGALWPAVAAARVSPLAAMRVSARPPWRYGTLACLLAGLVLIGIHHGLLRTPDADARYYRYAFAGLPLLFIGCFLLAVPLVRLSAVLLAPGLSRMLRLPPDLLRGSIAAAPYRAGFTAGALMIGMALLITSWAGAVSVRDGFIERIRFADGFAFRPTGIPPEQVRAIAELPFVEEICEVGQLQVRLVGEQVFGLRGISPRNVVLVGFDSEQFFRINRIEWIAGDPAVAMPRLRAGEGLLVAEQFLTAKGYGVGDRITLGVGRFEREFEILGVLSAAGLDVAAQLFGIQSAYSELSVSCVFLDAEVVRREFDNGDVHLVQVMLSEEISDEDAEALVAEAAPGVLFRSGRSILSMITDIADATLAVQTTVAFGALVLASLAVAGVIAADVTARRFEFGVLRSIGTDRRTISGLVAAEAALMACGGSLAGVILGLQMAMADISLMRDLAGLDVQLHLPLAAGAAGFLTVLVLALLASRPAARRLLRRPPAGLVS